MDTSIQRLLKMKKYIFWINSHLSIEKQSKEDWNTPIQLENKGPSIKVPLIFRFLVMNFSLCFYHQLWLQWVCIHIRNSSGHIEQTHSRFSKYLWMFDTKWNAHRLDIFDNFFDQLQPNQYLIITSTWNKKTVLYIVTLCTSKEASIY